MKKTILMCLLITSSIHASEYKLEINKSNYNKAISVESYTPPKLACDLPLVLNEEKTSCEEPPLVCEDPLIVNSEGDACFDPLAAIGWLYNDNCGGMRQAKFDPNVYFARSKYGVRRSLEIPEGYHWVSMSEYQSLYANSTVENKNSEWKYFGHCGLSGYPSSSGYTQYSIELSDTGSSGFHTGNKEGDFSLIPSSSGFSGYVLYKD
jgi:hypothetical protein